MGLWEVPPSARSGPGVHALAVACPHERAEEVLAPAEAAGLDVVAMDHPGRALARLASARDPAPRACLDLGWSAAVLVLVRAGRVLYERAIEDGALSSLMERLRQHTGLADEVIAALLCGPLRAGGQSRRSDNAIDRAGRCLDAHAEALARELTRSLEYLGHRFPGLGGSGEASVAAHMDVAGGGALVPGLVERLGRCASGPLRGLRAADVLEADEGLVAEVSSPALCQAAGLALAGRGGDA
jgi:Tfp pilus assembly PilM family ATPase